jgi:SAM-dependent methyltransferase
LLNLHRPLKHALKKIIPAGILKYVFDWLTARSPDRAVMVENLLPVFSTYSEVLWVGCRRYTKFYYRALEQQGAKCWTIDIDPDAARWGRTGRHVVGNLLDLEQHFTTGKFQAVLCNGVFGWGIDQISDQRAALVAMRNVMKPGGVLVLGWNTNRIADPVAAGLTRQLFEHRGLPDLPCRVVVPGSTHVYDIFHALDT